MLRRLLLIILKVQFNKAETKVILLKIRMSLILDGESNSSGFFRGGERRFHICSDVTSHSH